MNQETIDIINARSDLSAQFETLREAALCSSVA
jgi:hypothetical protein